VTEHATANSAWSGEGGRARDSDGRDSGEWFASDSVPRHLARGALGFGLIGAAFGLAAVVSPLALLLAPVGLIPLRGCPMCWTLGLIQTISAGRLRRSCDSGGEGCALRRV
jgi:hypothetical protein